MSVEAKLDVLIERTKTIKDDVKEIKGDVKVHATKIAKVEAKTKYQWAILVPLLLAVLGFGIKALAGG